MAKQWIAVAISNVMLVACAGMVGAGAINLPNASFELPTNSFVGINIDSWQKSAKPDWYIENGGFAWIQLTGSFKNTPPGNSDHLDNCDGNQAIWMFAVPEVGLLQDYNSMDLDDETPSRAFDVKFEVGNSYTLTVGVNGGGGGMSNGATMQISLYYRDATSNLVTVAATTITNTAEGFPTHTHLTDFQAKVPAVKAGDPWAGQNIGVMLLSTVTTNLQGGYWDLDNVRLSEVREPALEGLGQTNGQFQFTLHTEPGLKFEILASSDNTLSLSNWTSLGTITNVTGTTPFIDTATNFSQRFYWARQLP